jgi:ribosomal protein L37AE/L43A
MSGNVLPAVEAWNLDHAHEATPACPECGQLLGILLRIYSGRSRDVWLCEHCDETFEGHGEANDG